uniref:Uncharacterized protein n=2 Tax=Aplanochytrium stocchinoi TaxID=215587 RepID=A0A6S7ZRE1_9STRA
MTNYFEEATKSPAFKAKIEKKMCKVENIEWKVKNKGSDYIHGWPGDQERLQWIINENFDKVKVSNSLSGVHLDAKRSHNFKNLSACRVYLGGCVAYHGNSNTGAKMDTAKRLTKNEFVGKWNSAPHLILQSIPTLYLGQQNILDVLRKGFQSLGISSK